MNFYFKFGEHIYESDENSFWVSVLVTLIGTFIGFLLAFLASRQLEKRNQKRKNNEENQRKLDILKYLKSVLEAIADYIPNQTVKLKEFSNDLKENPLEIIQPEILATFDLLRLRNADNVNTQEAYIHYFNKSENPYKDYKNLFAHGDYLFREFTSIETQVTRETNFKYDDQLIVRDILEELSLLIVNRLEALAQDHGEANLLTNPEFQFLESLATSYKKITSEMMILKEVKSLMITPLMINALTVIQDSNLSSVIFKLTRKANSRLRNIEANSIHFSNDIIDIESRVADGLCYVKNEIRRLEEKITSHNMT
ncbi:MAG: hypothetical protein RIG77_26185 [Cyclobacteriaceae bacterium]